MNASWIQSFYRSSTTALFVIFLGSSFALAGPQPTNSLPATITTTDGVTYNHPKLSRVEPDGLLVEYQPAAGGTGLAKLKFVKLPESLQKEFGYDSGKSADYEQQQRLAMVELTQKLQQDEKVRSASLNVVDDTPARPNLAGAVVVNSSDPKATYNYYTPDQRPAKLDQAGLKNTVSTCDHTYTCHTDFDVRVTQNAAGQPLHFRIDKAIITLGLSCQFNLPVNPYDQVRIHEEGHRKIYESFYRLGPGVAKRIAEAMIGKDYTASESNYEQVKASALRKASAQIEAQYISQIDDVAKQASHYYNEITERGLNNIDRSQAAQQAVDKFAMQLQN
ncbi:MAG: hypothetical protein WDM80_05375 [Limisphaerales bacterium]